MSTRESFTQQYLPLATSVGERLQVDPNLLIAQWGLETGWGKSVIPGTNNLGNIKDFSGGGVAATDNMTGSRDKYLKFDTPEAFGDHYVGLINRKYPKVAGTGSNAEAFAQALRAGGYAEDPNYVSKIVNIATGQQLPNATGQGNTMNPSGYNPRDPNSVYQFILQNQQDVPVQQLTPEQRQMLMADRQKRASMLPLAIGASLAGDKRVSGLGKAMYDDAIEAQGAMKMGNEGWLTPDGQLIENPFTQATRKEGQRNRALEMAVQAVKAQQGGNPYYTPIPTANGLVAFDNRGGTVAPVIGQDGKPVVPATVDPALQGTISGAKAGGKVEGERSTNDRLDAPKLIVDAENTIRLVDELVKHPGMETAVGKSRMFGIQMIPGTDAKDFDIRLKQIQGKQFLEAFEKLKGGGAITQIEGEKATQAIARMDAAGSEEEFVKAAREFQDIVRIGVERARQAGSRGQTTTPTPPVSPQVSGTPSAPAKPSTPRSIDELLKQYE